MYLYAWRGLARWHSGKESACQCRKNKRRGFNSWVKKIPWRRKWQPAPVFLTGESYGQRSLVGYSHGVVRVWHDWATEHIHTHTHTHTYAWNPFPITWSGTELSFFPFNVLILKKKKQMILSSTFWFLNRIQYNPSNNVLHMIMPWILHGSLCPSWLLTGSYFP